MSPSASVFNTPDSQCFMLAVQHCPTANTTYICELQSLGLGLRVLSLSPSSRVRGAWDAQPAILSLPTLEVPLGN